MKNLNIVSEQVEIVEFNTGFWGIRFDGGEHVRAEFKSGIDALNHVKELSKKIVSRDDVDGHSLLITWSPCSKIGRSVAKVLSESA